MDVVADLPTDAQSPEPMQQGKRLLDDPAVLAQPGAVFGAAPGDDQRDTHRPNLPAILVVVVGTVGIHRVRPSSRAPAVTAYWRDVLDQRHELGEEDEQDAAHHFPVVQALAPRVIGTSRRDR